MASSATGGTSRSANKLENRKGQKGAKVRGSGTTQRTVFPFEEGSHFQVAK